MLWNAEIPVVILPGEAPANASAPNQLNSFAEGKVWIKIISGRVNAIQGIVENVVPVTYLHVKMEPNSKWQYLVAADHHTLVYVMEGTATVVDNSKSVNVAQGEFALFDGNGEAVNIQSTSAKVELLLLEGKPLNEPFAHQGPFVMNTREELMQAFRDYQRGDFGWMDDAYIQQD
jgi:redox-sensitive bicupin YhaK (pirin superfamily)